MTGEGPLFLSFRNELTDERWMFTPMDLSLDGEYHFPLIGNASQVVGEAKVAVRSGMVIITYLLVNGVKVDETSRQRLIAWVDAMCPYLGDEEVRQIPDPVFQGVDWLAIRPQIQNAPVIPRPGPVD